MIMYSQLQPNGKYRFYESYEDNMADINKKAGLLLKNIQSLSTFQIREACKNIFSLDRDAAVKSTHFKRCVMYLDLIENYSKEKSQ